MRPETITQPAPAAAPPAPPRRLSRLAIALLVGFLAVLAVASYKTWRDLVTVEARADELRGEIARSEAEISALQERLARLREDPEALERLARSELSMVRAGDVVVVLPPEAEERRSAESGEPAAGEPAPAPRPAP